MAFSSFPARATHPRYQEHRNRSSRLKVTAVQSNENFEQIEKHGFGLLGLSFNPAGLGPTVDFLISPYLDLG